MRKPLLIALLAGLLTFRAEAQTDYFRVSSVIFSGKTPPKDWFGTEQERQMIAALLRLSYRINDEKDVKRREFAREQIALGLARLGRETEARTLTKSADIQREITYFTAIRAILNGRENDAIPLLPQLSETQKINIQTLLGGAYYMWQNDKATARKWLLEARNSILKDRRRGGRGAYLELGIATNLAKMGAIDDAKAAFNDYEEYLRNQKSIGALSGMYRVVLFDARFRGGFEEDALAMLEKDKSLRPQIIDYFFRIKRDALALKLLNQETPVQGFEIVRDFNRGASEEEGKNLTAYKAMRTLWKRLPNTHKNEQNANEIVLAIARYESVRNSFNFIASNYKGKVASKLIRGLKAEVLDNANLQKQMNLKTLQSWRDEELKNEELRTKKSASALRELDGSDEESSWMLVYYAALRAKNLKKARFALDKSEQISKHSNDPYSNENTLSRYVAWLKLGDRQRANWNMLQFKREMAKAKDHPDAAYGFVMNYTPPEVVRELLLTQPPRKLSILSQLFSLDLLDGQNKVTIPDWYLKIPDAPTRAVLIANRARLLRALETVRIQID